MSKLDSHLAKEPKLKTRASVETDEEVKMQKCLSFTSQNFQKAKAEAAMNPEECRNNSSVLDLDLKGKLTDHRWKPICHRGRTEKLPIPSNFSKRKDHFLTVVSRLPSARHEAKIDV